MNDIRELIETLTEKVNEGVKVISKTPISDSNFSVVLQNTIACANLVSGFLGAASRATANDQEKKED